MKKKIDFLFLIWYIMISKLSIGVKTSHFDIFNVENHVHPLETN